MAKPVKTVLKLALEAGKANPAPPVGTALGPHGINIADFCKQYNEETRDKMGSIVPAEITIYDDRSFSFVLKTSPASDMLRKAANIEKGSGDPLKKKVGKVSRADIRRIAEDKMVDLNAYDAAQAEKIIEGTARSMGIEIEK
jgi:large subunit ribosomal protein L11